MAKESVRIEHGTPDANQITLVDWCFGNRCNFACSYCPERLHDGSIPWESYDSIIGFCAKLISHYDEMQRTICFQFSGGEPTLFPHFVELISHLKSLGCKVGIISNGSRRLPWWEEARRVLDFVVLTHHIEFVSLEHFIKVAQVLSDNLRTHVNVTMDPQRFSECFNNAQRIADECSNISMTLKPLLVNFGPTMYAYTDAQREILQQPSLDIKHTRPLGGFRGAMRRIYADGSSDMVNAAYLLASEQNRWLGWSCHIGIELLHIDFRGDVYRGACKQGKRVGNIIDPKIELPIAPVICHKQICHCVTDIMTTRTKHLS
jgi:MoaA/NifB/PqqE/SkfB family radical SAM enzyme